MHAYGCAEGKVLSLPLPSFLRFGGTANRNYARIEPRTPTACVSQSLTGRIHDGEFPSVVHRWGDHRLGGHYDHADERGSRANC